MPLDLFWTFSGRAGPTVSPLRGGVSVNKMGSKVSMLYIDAASSSRHAGNYTCVATNRAGRADRTAALNVHGKTAQRLHYTSIPTIATLTVVKPVVTHIPIILLYSKYHVYIRTNVCLRWQNPAGLYLNMCLLCFIT